MVELSGLMADASRLRDRGHGRLISYSRKVFIPLTHLCRDVCHYCTFAERPRAGQPAYLSPERVSGASATPAGDRNTSTCAEFAAFAATRYRTPNVRAVSS